VLSWAPPPYKHQKEGHHHVNCQENTYVICVLRLFGLVQDQQLQVGQGATLDYAR
jgi:hypothetical protein